MRMTIFSIGNPALTNSIIAANSSYGVGTLGSKAECPYPVIVAWTMSLSLCSRAASKKSGDTHFVIRTAASTLSNFSTQDKSTPASPASVIPILYNAISNQPFVKTSWNKSLRRLRPVSCLYTAHISRAVVPIMTSATIKPPIKIKNSAQPQEIPAYP